MGVRRSAGAPWCGGVGGVVSEGDGAQVLLEEGEGGCEGETKKEGSGHGGRGGCGEGTCARTEEEGSTPPRLAAGGLGRGYRGAELRAGGDNTMKAAARLWQLQRAGCSRRGRRVQATTTKRGGAERGEARRLAADPSHLNEGKEGQEGCLLV